MQLKAKNHSIITLFYCKLRHLNHEDLECICHPRHLDIRDAILQLLKVIRDSSKKSERQDKLASDTLSKILQKVSKLERNGPGGQATVRKIDNISTFLLRYSNESNRCRNSIFEVTWNISMNPRMNSKLNSIDNQVKKGGRGTSGGGGGRLSL